MEEIQVTVKNFLAEYRSGGLSADQTTLSKKEAEWLIKQCFRLLFPEKIPKEEYLQKDIESLHPLLSKIFINLSGIENTEAASILFFQELIKIRQDLLTDAQFFLEGDPAADSIQTIINAYPGFFAITVYRIANYFYVLGAKKTARLLSENAHSVTGIDIHPGAIIQSPFMIDHGTGVVIGETSKIGKYVKLYQGVTLGALSVKNNAPNVQRHPSIEDHVTIYAQATILGGQTVVGKGSVVGGNVWLVKSVAPNTKIMAIFDQYRQSERS